MSKITKNFISNKAFTRTPKFGVTPKGGGFTLIELLVVVAIIGLLAAVVLVSLQASRNRSRDSFLKEQANQMRILLEQEYTETGSYAQLQRPTGWISTYNDCDWSNVPTLIGTRTFLGNNASKAKEICNAIVSQGFEPSPQAKFYIGNIVNNSQKYSIMVGLSTGKYLCLGSNGVTNNQGTVSPGNESGCYLDTNL